MNLPFNIARRYFFSRKSGGSFNLISIISGISLLGYIVGAGSLLLVLSVFNGFESLFINMYNKFDSDIKIVAAKGKSFEINQAVYGRIKNIEGVIIVSKTLEENALLKYGERQNIATIKGVDENYKSVAEVDSSIVAGVSMLQSGDTNFAIVGQGIAYQLSVDPEDVFNRLGIYVPKPGVVDALNPEEAFSHAIISPVGIFGVQEEVDNKYVIVPLRFMQKLLNLDNKISSIDIKISKDKSMDEVKTEIEKILGERFIVQNRFEQRDAFFKIERTEKQVSYLILLFILLVSASNTIGSLYILVIEKKRDLQILSSMGLTKEQAASIFKYEGIFLAVIGGLVGLILAATLCILQEKYGIIKIAGTESFAIDHYPVKLKISDMFLVFITVFILGWITSIYPARKAKQLFLG